MKVLLLLRASFASFAIDGGGESMHVFWELASHEMALN
jgi:hypothetical protein